MKHPIISDRFQRESVKDDLPLNLDQNIFTCRLRIIEPLFRSTVTHWLAFHLLPTSARQ